MIEAAVPSPGRLNEASTAKQLKFSDPSVAVSVTQTLRNIQERRERRVPVPELRLSLTCTTNASIKVTNPEAGLRTMGTGLSH